jgi:hypothetical protein
VPAAAHLHDHQDSPKLAVDLDIALQDNVVTQKRDPVELKLKSSKEATTSTVVSTVTPAPVSATMSR